MDDPTDITSAAPGLDPGEQRAAAAVHDALGGRAPSPGLLGVVQRRAARRHRRRLAGGATGAALALAGLLAVVPLDLLPIPTRTPQEAPATPASRAKGSSEGLTAASLLTLDDVASVVPVTTRTRPPAVPGPDEPPGASLHPGPQTDVGSCSDAGVDLPPAAERWTAGWSSDPGASSGFATSLEQEVLRYDAAEDATGYTLISRGVDDRCPRPGDPGARDLRVEEPGGPLVTLRTTPLEDSERGWVVRGVSAVGDGGTVVDLTLVVEADTSDEAGVLGDRLLDLAVQRAGGDPAVEEPAPEPAPPPDSAATDAPPLDEASFLTLDELDHTAPGAQVVEAPAPVGVSQQEPPPPPTGGWCGDAVLDGVPAADQAWSAQWLGEQAADTGLSTEVVQVVLRWSEPAAAEDHVQATRRSDTECGDAQDAPSDQASFFVLPAPAIAGVPSVAVAAVEGSPERWQVRAAGVAGDGTTVVDLTVTLYGETADAAGAEVTDLLLTALERASSTGGTTP